MKINPIGHLVKTNPIKPNLKNAQAAVAYDHKAEQLLGQFAYLNFPNFTAESAEKI